MRKNFLLNTKYTSNSRCLLKVSMQARNPLFTGIMDSCGETPIELLITSKKLSFMISIAHYPCYVVLYAIATNIASMQTWATQNAIL